MLQRSELSTLALMVCAKGNGIQMTTRSSMLFLGLLMTTLCKLAKLICMRAVYVCQQKWRLHAVILGRGFPRAMR